MQPIEAIGTPAFLPYPDPPDAERVHVQVLRDERGEVQVLLPPLALLDIDRLRSLTGRSLWPWTPEPGTRLSGIPGAEGRPVVIDEHLIAGPSWALPTTVADAFVAVSGPELLAGPVQIQIGEFCTILDTQPTPRDREGDLGRIEESVSRFTERRMRQRLDETLQIPPLPLSARQIIALQADPDCELREVVIVVESDPSLAARIVGWANSAFYSPRTPVRNVSDAINRVLGIRTAVSMALGISLGGTLRLPKSQVSDAPPFWLEALLTASTLEALAQASSLPDKPGPGDAYLLGLLANFGTLVLGHVFPNQYAQICRLQEANPHLPHPFIDQHVLQLPREIIASALLESWDLPESVTQAVRFQHVTDHDGDWPVHAQLLRFARQLLNEQGLIVQPLPGHVVLNAEQIAIEPRRLASIVDRLHASRDQLEGVDLLFAS